VSTNLAAVRLLIATPAYHGVSNNYFHATHKFRKVMNTLELKGSFVTAPGMPVDAARDFIGNAFISSQASATPFTHLLMADSDIGFEPDTVLRMIARDADFVAAAPPLRRFDWKAVEKAAAEGRADASKLAALYAVKPLQGGKLSVDADGFAPIEHVGGAFLLLRPRVFTAISDAYPDLRHREGWMYFQPAVFDGERKGEDIAFCKRWRKTGGDIWLLVDAPLTHEGPYTFSGSYRDLTTLASS